MKNYIKEESQILEQLALEAPEKLCLTEAGTIMQDYIIAYMQQGDLSAKSEKYLTNLLYAIVDRMNRNTKVLN